MPLFERTKETLALTLVTDGLEKHTVRVDRGHEGKEREDGGRVIHFEKKEESKSTTGVMENELQEMKSAKERLPRSFKEGE